MALESNTFDDWRASLVDVTAEVAVEGSTLSQWLEEGGVRGADCDADLLCAAIDDSASDGDGDGDDAGPPQCWFVKVPVDPAKDSVELKCVSDPAFLEIDTAVHTPIALGRNQAAARAHRDLLVTAYRNAFVEMTLHALGAALGLGPALPTVAAPPGPVRTMALTSRERGETATSAACDAGVVASAPPGAAVADASAAMPALATSACARAGASIPCCRSCVSCVVQVLRLLRVSVSCYYRYSCTVT